MMLCITLDTIGNIKERHVDRRHQQVQARRGRAGAGLSTDEIMALTRGA